MTNSQHDATPEQQSSTGAGWNSDLPTFESTEAHAVCIRLADFVADADQAQKAAWESWVPQLQRQAEKLMASHPPAADYTAILEYRMPRDLRRPDVIVLEGGVVVVVELKGLQTSERAGLDQVLAYARDLRAYHAECHDRPVVPVLVRPTASDEALSADGAWIVSPKGIHKLLQRLAATLSGPHLSTDRFLRDDAYCPLPSIVNAARELFEHGDLPYIRRARASTDPALQTISRIAREAAATKTRHFVVLQGVPGSGKTLVGLQIVHARWLDALATCVADSARPKVPAVYLTGNGPLQEVLQHALSAAGGGGQTFVQGVKKYVSYYSKRNRVPPEHVVVFDEAQRAHDAEQVAYVHKTAEIGQSEPEHLLEFMGRVPDWCVLVALVGTGQAIHSGEEVGLPLWRDALLKSQSEGSGKKFTVHAPAHVEEALAHPDLEMRWEPSLNLDTEIRHHLVKRVHQYVEHLLDDAKDGDAGRLADDIWVQGHRFLLTRDLEEAKEYVRQRYEESPLARYGLIASSRCKRLVACGVDNTFQTTKRLRVGPWYNSPPTDPASCRNLETVATEFQTQGLELDMAIVAWGTDYRRKNGQFTDDLATRYKKKVRDSLALRRNAYRVLLTRGRDGSLIYVPHISEMDDTYEWLTQVGCRTLEAEPHIGSTKIN
jgi:Uncharacterized conserved protein (DUF2075)